jgi:cytochrome b561
MREYFTPLQRTLHWLMAAMVLAMLFIGIGMVSTLQPKFLTLIAIHRPLGIAILLLAIFRLGVRLRRGAPSLPADLPLWQAISAKASHYLLYALLIAMPLVGWSMLSAGGFPIVLGGPIHLPKIMPHNDELYAFLRSAHTILAFLFFATILLHVGAALFHRLIRQDGVFSSMAGRWSEGVVAGSYDGARKVMGEQAWRGAVALAQDLLNAAAFFGQILPGGATLGEAVRVRLEKRRREAIELLISRIEQGERAGIVFGEEDADNFVATMLRFIDAEEKGTAKENLDLLSKVIVGLKRNRLFEFDQFQKWCTTLESLTHDEILFIGAAYGVKSTSTPQSPPFWEGVRAQLANTFTNDEIESLAAALTRTGLITSVGALSGTSYVPSERLSQLGELAMQND